MKARPHRRHLLGGLVLLSATVVLSSWAQEPAPSSPGNSQQEAYRSSLIQENIRKQADQVETEINELSAELQLNNLDPAGSGVLTQAANALKDISAEEMSKVVDALRNASFATDNREQKRLILTAYQGQQSILLKLKSLASVIAAAEERQQIPSMLKDLIARQAANLRQTQGLSPATSGQMTPDQKTTHDLVTSEQQAISDEIGVLKEIIAKPAADETAPTDTSLMDLLRVLNTGALTTTAARAAQATAAIPFPDAVRSQTALKEQLTSLLGIALSKLDAETRLQQAKELLDETLTDQKNLGAAEKQAHGDASLAERQASLEDRTAVLDALVKPIDHATSAQIGQTQTDMKDASSALASHSSEADQKQQAVVGDLEKAEARLNQEIAAAEREEELSPTDKLAALQQLKQSIDNARTNPQTTTQDLHKLQDQVAPLAPEAAADVAGAADQAALPQPDKNAINQNLAQAGGEIQKQETALAQTAQQYRTLAEASSALAQAELDGRKAAQSITSTPQDLTKAAYELSQAARAVNEAQQAGQGMPPSGPGGRDSAPQQDGNGTQHALQEAADALRDATMAAVQARGPVAQADDHRALAAMQTAQAGLKASMARLQDSNNAGSPRQGFADGRAEIAGMYQGNGLLKGGLGGYSGPGQVVGSLNPKDRAAIEQYQTEKSPPEYAPQIQQYLKNLANSSSSDAR
jgi:hypothetical protein